MTYIALLRGINVGGHTVKMDVLRGLFAELGFTQVRSYIQTGNIFFESEEVDRQTLRQKIEKHLEKSLGFNVAVCIRTVDELEEIIRLDPFKGRDLTPDTRFAITFLADAVDEILKVPQKTPDGAYELIKMTPTELFVIWHLKNGRPGNSYGFLEKSLNTQGTTRFWHTTAKILKAAKS
jgi:uncharacterized protein (DUF1697 family)